MISLMFKLWLENTDYLYYSKFVFVHSDLLSNLMIKRNMTIILLLSKRQICLHHLKIKIEVIYSLVNPCGKNKHRHPINKKETRNRGVKQRDNHPTQGYKRIRNYIQMACIVNMLKKQCN